MGQPWNNVGRDQWKWVSFICEIVCEPVYVGLLSEHVTRHEKKQSRPWHPHRINFVVLALVAVRY